MTGRLCMLIHRLVAPIRASRIRHRPGSDAIGHLDFPPACDCHACHDDQDVPAAVLWNVHACKTALLCMPCDHHCRIALLTRFRSKKPGRFYCGKCGELFTTFSEFVTVDPLNSLHPPTHRTEESR